MGCCTSAPADVEEQSVSVSKSAKKERKRERRVAKTNLLAGGAASSVDAGSDDESAMEMSGGPLADEQLNPAAIEAALQDELKTEAAKEAEAAAAAEERAKAERAKAAEEARAHAAKLNSALASRIAVAAARPVSNVASLSMSAKLDPSDTAAFDRFLTYEEEARSKDPCRDIHAHARGAGLDEARRREDPEGNVVERDPLPTLDARAARPRRVRPPLISPPPHRLLPHRT